MPLPLPLRSFNLTPMPSSGTDVQGRYGSAPPHPFFTVGRVGLDDRARILSAAAGLQNAGRPFRRPTGSLPHPSPRAEEPDVAVRRAAGAGGEDLLKSRAEAVILQTPLIATLRQTGKGVDDLGRDAEENGIARVLLPTPQEAGSGPKPGYWPGLETLLGSAAGPSILPRRR